MFKPAFSFSSACVWRGALVVVAALGLWGCGLLRETPRSAPTAVETAQVSVASPAAPTDTVLPLSAEQMIMLDTPPPGTTVGSPVVITGRTARLPAAGALAYSIRGGSGDLLGSGSFPVALAPEGTGAFTASLTFNLPASGGSVTLEVYEPGPVGQPALATTMLPLTVAAPQAILIDSPPPGTVVGSPVVLTGRTAHYPFQGNLAYRVLDVAGRELGAGTVPVQGAPGGPSSFTGSLTFTLPPNGGRITVELSDQNAATARVDLSVATPAQAIVVESPPAGTLVGSPVVIAGSTALPPRNGRLYYTVRGPAGETLGQGEFPVPVSAGRTANIPFVTSIMFAPPAQGGEIVFELFDRDAVGNPVDGAIVTLQVGPRAP